MRTSERHHLKDNELAIALGHAGEFAQRNQRSLTLTIGAIVLIGVAAVAFFVWRNSVDGKAREGLAQAMVVLESRVIAPAPTTPGVTPTQQAGTFPTEKAKLEAALPKFMSVADTYPSTEAGRTARFHAAATLVALEKYDDAIKQYDQVASGGGLLSQSAKLGRAEAQLAAKQYDAAIGGFKDLSEKNDTKMPKEAILLELARAYKIAGKTEDARKTLNQIVEQHAESPFAAAARQELDKIKS